MELTPKNNDILTKAKEKVDEAVNLEKQIDKLDDAIKFLGSEIGFLDIKINYNNQGEVGLASLLGSKATHDAFRVSLQAAIVDYRNALVLKFNNLKF